MHLITPFWLRPWRAVICGSVFMRTLVIINNVAAKAQRAWPSIQQQLNAAGVDYEVYRTTAPGDASTQTRAALKAGVTTVAVVGGDGTLSEAAEGFFEFSEQLDELPSPVNSAASLAILPAGTGDDFARGLKGGNWATLDHWIDILISHHQGQDEKGRRVVDVLYGRCDGYRKPFICL